MPDRLNQIVSGEPSLGSLHAHYYRLVTGGDPSGAGYTTVDCSAQVPSGTTTVYLHVHCHGSSADYVAIYTDNAPTPANPTIVSRVSSVTGEASGFVQLTTSLTFVYYANAGTVSGVDIDMFFYTADMR
jgi:hypothetical protein